MATLAIKPSILSGWFGHHATPTQQTTDPAVLKRHAEMARAKLEKYARALAQELKLNPDMTVTKSDIKNSQRHVEKAKDRYNGHVDKVCDLCRLRLLIEKPQDIENIRSIFVAGRKSSFHSTWVERGYQWVELEDYYKDPKPHGFIGANLIVSVDLGKGRYHDCEIQLMHKDMQNTYNISHILYKEIRKIEEGAKAEGRKLTDTELVAVEGYKSANRELYEADAYNYGLNKLRRSQNTTNAPIARAELDAA